MALAVALNAVSTWLAKFTWTGIRPLAVRLREQRQVVADGGGLGRLADDEPMPAFALTCPATTKASQATPRLCRTPVSAAHDVPLLAAAHTPPET